MPERKFFMFDFKKKPVANDSAPFCYSFHVAPDGLMKYEVDFEWDKCNPKEVQELVKEILQMLTEKNVSFQTAMQLPSMLHEAIAGSAENHLTQMIFSPLLPDYDRADQSDDRNDQRDH